MSRWKVTKWLDGSQDDQDKWNIQVPDDEAHVAYDLPYEVAAFIVKCHHFDLEAQQATIAKQQDLMRAVVEARCDLGAAYPHSNEYVNYVVADMRAHDAMQAYLEGKGNE